MISITLYKPPCSSHIGIVVEEKLLFWSKAIAWYSYNRKTDEFLIIESPLYPQKEDLTQFQKAIFRQLIEDHVADNQPYTIKIDAKLFAL